jgi:hypothetical protein
MTLLLLNNAPPPVNDPIATPPQPPDLLQGKPDVNAGKVTQPWLEYFNATSQVLDAAPVVLNRVKLTTIAASIAATDFSGGGINQGLYRLSYYARITQAAGTSSSLTVTISWTDDSTSLSLSTSAMTGNTVTTVAGASLIIESDAVTPVRYATTYASSGSPVMQYKLNVVIEKLVA